MKRVVIVERGRGKGNFSCFMTSPEAQVPEAETEALDKYAIGGAGRTAREAMEDTLACLEEYREMAKQNGETFPDVELEFKFDIGSFFDYYPLDVTSTAKCIGMNASVLRQYVTGIREPKQKQIDKIRTGLSQLFAKMSEDVMIDRPLEEYVL